MKIPKKNCEEIILMEKRSLWSESRVWKKKHKKENPENVYWRKKKECFVKNNLKNDHHIITKPL